MTKKHVKTAYIVFQVLLIGFMFLPVGVAVASDASPMLSLSVFGMIQRYGGMGFSNDALVYLVFACALPILSVVLLLRMKERKNFGTVSWLSAFYTLVAACFFSAAKEKMVDSVSMTGLHYVIILVSLAAMIAAILGFFLAAPKPNGEAE